ncbi:conserved hypothetical protein [Coccidioides posadasii str. Silveira]|uniref:Uncharacterized protein n=1 Tax=Coccidioides posadasii (strain RMSCC 757 / Silveira) TaxID=443226 RepID=E9DGL3_COCPS|nr:conserved hypothetical protein [Coccidioides posadasii str. Silveira]
MYSSSDEEARLALHRPKTMCQNISSEVSGCMRSRREEKSGGLEQHLQVYGPWLDLFRVHEEAKIEQMKNQMKNQRKRKEKKRKRIMACKRIDRRSRSASFLGEKPIGFPQDRWADTEYEVQSLDTYHLTLRPESYAD